MADELNVSTVRHNDDHKARIKYLQDYYGGISANAVWLLGVSTLMEKVTDEIMKTSVEISAATPDPVAAEEIRRRVYGTDPFQVELVDK